MNDTENRPLFEGCLQIFSAYNVRLLRDIYHEVHTLGLFSYNDWLMIFKDNNLKADEIQMNHLYDKYLLEDGQYKLKVFAGILQTGDGSLYHSFLCHDTENRPLFRKHNYHAG